MTISPKVAAVLAVGSCLAAGSVWLGVSQSSAVQESCDPTVAQVTAKSDQSPSGLTRDIIMIGTDCSQTEVASSASHDEAAPALAPNGRDIAYVSFSSDHKQASIVISDAETLKTTILYSAPTALGGLTWAGDGRSLAFWAAKDGKTAIWSIASDGTDPTPLTDGSTVDVMPSWSPDGSQVAFSRASSEGARIVLLEVSSGIEHVLGTGQGSFERPTWSPDGQQLVSNVRSNDYSLEHLAIVNVSTGQITARSPETLAMVVDLGWDSRGISVASAAEDQGGSRVTHFYDGLQSAAEEGSIVPAVPDLSSTTVMQETAR